MSKDVNTLISIVVLAAKLANELPRWVNEATRFMEVDGSARIYDLPYYVDSVNGWLFTLEVSPFLATERVYMQAWRYVLEGTRIDGLYELHMGFGELSNTVLYHVEKIKTLAYMPSIVPGAKPYIFTNPL